MHTFKSLNGFIINKALAPKGLVSISDIYESRLILQTH